MTQHRMRKSSSHNAFLYFAMPFTGNDEIYFAGLPISSFFFSHDRPPFSLRDAEGGIYGIVWIEGLSAEGHLAIGEKNPINPVNPV